MGRRRHFLCPQRLFDNNVAGQRVVRGRQDRLPQLYIRRILRRWHPFAVFLFVVVLKISLSEGQKTASFEAVAVSVVYLMNWSRAFIWWEQYKLGHTWSLAMGGAVLSALARAADAHLRSARYLLYLWPNRCDGHVAMLPRAERCGS